MATQKNHLSEMVLMSTHNLSSGYEIECNKLLGLNFFDALKLWKRKVDINFMSMYYIGRLASSSVKSDLW